MKKIKTLIIGIIFFAFILLITSCSSTDTSNHIGTYYLYEKENYNKEIYIILESNTWKDDDNASGEYSISGENIIFYVDFLGSKEELYSGTIKDGVMVLKILGKEVQYCKEGKAPSQSGTEHAHNYSTEWTIDKEATCTEAGSKSHHCLDCNEKKDVTTIPATGHSFGDWTTTKEPTETSTGIKERTCSVCKYKETDTILKLPHTHNYSTEWTIDKEATCTEVGSKSHHCLVCDDKTDITSIPATGHDYSTEWTIDKEATCTEVGSKSHYCLVCDDKTDITTIPATGHDYSTEWTIDKEATCTEVGSKSHHCLVCDDKADITSIDAMGHNYGEWEVIKEATSTTTGQMKRVCDNCKNEESKILYLEISTKGLKYFMDPMVDKTYAVSGIGTATDSNIIIPSTYNMYPVTSIRASAFMGQTKFSSIVIGNLVSKIGASAFRNCTNLQYVELGENVINIETDAFSYCRNLRNITIGKNVTSIGNNAFYNCSSLTNVYYEGTIEDWCKIEFGNEYSNPMQYAKNFYLGNYHSTSHEFVSEIEIPNSVTEIGDYQFYGFNNVVSITIPGSVTSIGQSAFSGCSSLTSVVIPDSVTSIGDDAFYGCSKLTEVYYEGTIEDWCKTEFGNKYSNPMSYASHFYIRNNNQQWEEIIDIPTLPIFVYSLNNDKKSYTLMKANTDDKAIMIPKTFKKFPVTSIGSSAFENCSSLTSIVIPDSVTSIGESAFESCSSLTNIEIPNSVTSIGSSAFSGCSSLTSIVIPDSVTSIGSSAFYNCSSLTNVYYEGTIEDWCKISLDYGSSNPMNYANHFYLRNSNNEWEEVTSIDIPEGVTEIGRYQFYGFNNVKSIIIPNSVISIGSYAFSGCSSLTSIVIPESVTSIGSTAFYNCSSLTNVYYEGTIEDWCKISLDYVASNPMNYANHFYLRNSNNEWEEVTSIDIPNTIPKIGKYQFDGFNNVILITIPNSVTSIGSYAFSGCSNIIKATLPTIAISTIPKDKLQEVIITGGTSIGSYAFSGCSSLTSITIPNSVTSIGSYAFSGCSSLTSITIPNSVTSIGRYAFRDCSSLTSIVIPESVTSIGESAFESCSSLTNIEIPNSVTSIGSSAFESCSSLTNIEIPNSVTSIGSSAFENCSSLESITIPFVGASKDGTSNTHFGYIFGASSKSFNSSYVPSSLKEVIIAGGTSIGLEAFYNCNSLTSIVIPESVTSIRYGAFIDCSNLKEVYYTGTSTQWDAISINSPNSELIFATRYYYSETQPTSTGYYWHYVNGVPTKW